MIPTPKRSESKPTPTHFTVWISPFAPRRGTAERNSCNSQASRFEARNFKFGTQLGFGTSLPKNVLVIIVGIYMSLK